MWRGGEGVEETSNFNDVVKGKVAEEDGTEDLEPGFRGQSAFAEGDCWNGGVVENVVENENLELKGQLRRHFTVAGVGRVGYVGCREVQEAKGKRQETKESWPRKKEG